jgi:hypothetical protein
LTTRIARYFCPAASETTAVTVMLSSTKGDVSKPREKSLRSGFPRE